MGAAVIALLGSGVLTAAAFAPRGQVGLVAAIVPPWQAAGMAAAATTGLPVVDLRWGGHVMILDTGGDAAVLAHLRAQGFWLLDAGGQRGCGAKGAAT
jgi:hypothetical protein